MVFAADVGLWRTEDGWLRVQGVCRKLALPCHGPPPTYTTPRDAPPLLLRWQRTIGLKETRFGLLTDLLTDSASLGVI
jgi:hypothetical protein